MIDLVFGATMGATGGDLVCEFHAILAILVQFCGANDGI